MYPFQISQGRNITYYILIILFYLGNFQIWSIYTTVLTRSMMDDGTILGSFSIMKFSVGVYLWKSLTLEISVIWWNCIRHQTLKHKASCSAIVKLYTKVSTNDRQELWWKSQFDLLRITIVDINIITKLIYELFLCVGSTTKSRSIV